MKTMNAQNIEAPWTHTFLYGDTGCGKTTAAASWPKPLFLVPTHEGSAVALAGRDVDYLYVTGMDQNLRDGHGGGLNTILTELENIYRADPNKFPWDTIVLESMSHYTDLVQEDLTGGQGSTQIMDQPRWGKLASHLRHVVMRLRAIDVHVVYTSLAKVDQDAAGFAVGGPLMPGQAAYKLPSACDIIGYMRSRKKGKDTIYETHFRQYEHFPARTRFRGIPAKFEDLTFAKLDEYLQPVRKELPADATPVMGPGPDTDDSEPQPQA